MSHMRLLKQSIRFQGDKCGVVKIRLHVEVAKLAGFKLRLQALFRQRQLHAHGRFHGQHI